MERPARAPSPSISDRLHKLSSTALDYVRARVDLLQHEWREERGHLLGVMWRWALFALAALTLYQMTAAFIVLALWETPWRLHALGGVLLVTAGITTWAWRSVQTTLARSETPFARSLAEFDKDREILRQLGEADATAIDRADDARHNGVPSPSAAYEVDGRSPSDTRADRAIH